MSHEIESIMFVGETPWHGLGHAFTEQPEFGQVLAAAGLNWKVVMHDLFTADRMKSEARAIRRETDGAMLGTALGNVYEPLQNDELLEVLRPFVESGNATIETAGSLRGGQRVWVMARVKNCIGDVVKGDPVIAYIMISNAHDGRTAIRIGFSPIRVVCANTLRMAHNDTASKLIRVIHTKATKKTLVDVAATMDLARAEFNATIETYQRLAKSACNEADLKKFVRLVFKGEVKHDDTVADIMALPEAADAAEGSDLVFKKILPFFEKGRGNDKKNVRGTMWAAYNAVTEYLAYDRGVPQLTTRDTRLDSLWFGASDAINRKAIKVAVAMAA